MSTGFHTVHVRINDAATGRPTPCRVRFTGPGGEYLAPFGRLTEFATGPNQDVGGNLQLGAKKYAYIDGACEIQLPAGPITVEVSKGFEYAPLCQQVTLRPGKIALRLALQRWTDLRQEGWSSGDTRAHFLSPHAALLEAAAEDLAVVNLLANECQVEDCFGKQLPAIANLLAFSGQQPALERPGHVVVVNTHNRHAALGSLGLLNCHRPVFPLSFGGPGRPDNWSLADWCDQCHRKGGLVVWTRVGQGSLPWGEVLADLVLGKVDAFEIDSYEDSPFDVLADWYTLLNCGLRVPLVGGSGKDGNGVPLGGMRTYARVQAGESFSYKSWIDAVRAGRTFATNGPLLSFAVAGQGAGGVVELTSPGRSVRVKAEARSIAPFDRLEVVACGKVVTHAEASGSPAVATVETEVTCPAAGWLAARCRGSHLLSQRPAPQRVFAHTSAVDVRVGGQRLAPEAASVKVLHDQLDALAQWVQREGCFENEAQREHLMEAARTAREVLEKNGIGGR